MVVGSISLLINSDSVHNTWIFGHQKEAQRLDGHDIFLHQRLYSLPLQVLAKTRRHDVNVMAAVVVTGG